MNFFGAVISCFKRFAVFSGRSSRSEFWYFVLFDLIINYWIILVEPSANPLDYNNLDESPLRDVWHAVLVIPFLSVGVRRLHDINRSGWWILIQLTIIGIIPYFCWLCTKGDQSDNRFGSDPLTPFEDLSTKERSTTVADAGYTEVVSDTSKVEGDQVKDESVHGTKKSGEAITSQEKHSSELTMKAMNGNPKAQTNRPNDIPSEGYNTEQIVEESNKDRRTPSLITPENDHTNFYEIVGTEIEDSTYQKGLWIKALVDADGDKKKQKVLYIRYRVAQLVAKTNEKTQA